MDTCNLHCLFVTFTAKTKPDFIDAELLSRMKQRDKAFQTAWRSRNSEDFNLAKTPRQSITKDLRLAKRKFILTQIDMAKGDAKRFWKVINTSFFLQQGVSMTQILDENSNEVLTGSIAAEYVNSYFCNISKQMSKCFPPIDIDELTMVTTDTCIEHDWPPILNVDSVLSCIKKIDVSKASGFPEINSKLLKESLLCLNNKFTYLINLGLEQCQFPECWKSATVVVIPKKGNSNLVSNLRPISLLPATGKIMETFINQFIIDFMTDNDRFAKQQMGFRKDCSTIEGCFNLIKDILDALNEGLISMAVYIDLAKAFNTVNHAILISKLKKLGLPDKILDLLTSYLDS